MASGSGQASSVTAEPMFDPDVSYFNGDGQGGGGVTTDLLRNHLQIRCSGCGNSILLSNMHRARHVQNCRNDNNFFPDVSTWKESMLPAARWEWLYQRLGVINSKTNAVPNSSLYLKLIPSRFGTSDLKTILRREKNPLRREPVKVFASTNPRTPSQGRSASHDSAGRSKSVTPVGQAVSHQTSRPSSTGPRVGSPGSIQGSPNQRSASSPRSIQSQTRASRSHSAGPDKTMSTSRSLNTSRSHSVLSRLSVSPARSGGSVNAGSPSNASLSARSGSVASHTSERSGIRPRSLGSPQESPLRSRRSSWMSMTSSIANYSGTKAVVENILQEERRGRERSRRSPSRESTPSLSGSIPYQPGAKRRRETSSTSQGRSHVG